MVLDCIVSEYLSSCTLVTAVVNTQRVFSSHGGFLACVTLESQFNKSAEKMFIYKKNSLI